MDDNTPEVSPGGHAPPVESRDMDDPHSDIFFAAVETTRMPMLVTDPHQPDNPIIFANPAFIAMTGYSREELIGRNCRFLQGPETDRGRIDEVREAVKNVREIAVEILNYRKNGSTFWNALFISPVYDRQGKLIYFFASQLDVSRRKDAEDALRQAQKMEALGQLTGGIAHDFNNLLQVIIGYVDSLKDRAALHEDARMTRAAENIGQAAERAAALTQQLLAFARKQRLEGRAVNLNAVVENMTELASRTLGSQIDFHTKLDPDLWNCRLDTVQAELAVLNVLINARDAMPNGGEVTIETANRQVDAEDSASFGGLEPGPYVCIAVTDNGPGMAPDILARAMDPFFTTKEEGKGTGLGLSMVYGFAKQSGGLIRIYSEVGRGTTVRFFFPASRGDLPLSQSSPSLRAVDRQGSETILIVEDREDVGELARSILEDFGYNAIRANNADEALERLDALEKVDLLFSDLIMPGSMNGVMLAREARRRQPKLKVLLTTGFAETALERSEMAGSEFEVINKPYRRMELVRKVRVILDGPTGVG